MSSEMTLKVIPVVSNTHTGQRDSGYSVVSGKPCASRHPTGKNAMDSRNEGTGKLYDSGVYVSRHLSLSLYRKACIRKTIWEPRPEPDSGNPTVRDRREAYGNVSYGKG
jgi:hypothetical protein